MTTETCVNCSAPLRLTAKFCDQCGQKIAVADAAPPRITVLYAAIVNAAEPGLAAEARRPDKIVATISSAVEEVVNAYGGSVYEVDNQGITAVFGPASGTRHQSQWACYAALAMARAIETRPSTDEASEDARVRLRVGLTSADVAEPQQQSVPPASVVATAQQIATAVRPGWFALDKVTAQLAGDALIIDSPQTDSGHDVDTRVPASIIIPAGIRQAPAAGTPYAPPDVRASYVISRLADDAAGFTDQDWTHIQQELTWAYRQIDVVQIRDVVATYGRRILALIVAFCVVALVQSQLDWLWNRHPISARTLAHACSGSSAHTACPSDDRLLGHPLPPISGFRPIRKGSIHGRCCGSFSSCWRPWR